METFTVIRQGDRRKNPIPALVRRLTEEEVLALCAGAQVMVILNNGCLGTCKINGAVRKWKRDPQRVEVPVKYGMYEYAVFTLPEALNRFVVEVN